MRDAREVYDDAPEGVQTGIGCLVIFVAALALAFALRGFLMIAEWSAVAGWILAAVVVVAWIWWANRGGAG